MTVATVVAWAFSLPVETIGSRFGGIPETLPSPVVPAFSFAKMQAVLPDAIAFALLAAIESLLSAVVADGMMILIWFLASFPRPPLGATEPAIDFSLAAMIGHWIEPVLAPIGFNWQISVALIPGMLSTATSCSR